MLSAICKRNTCYRRAKLTGPEYVLNSYPGSYKHLRNKVMGMVKRGKSDYTWITSSQLVPRNSGIKAVKNLILMEGNVLYLHSNIFRKTANSDSEKANMLNFNKIPPIIPSSGLV